jgi:hypothetical protein
MLRQRTVKIASDLAHVTGSLEGMADAPVWHVPNVREALWELAGRTRRIEQALLTLSEDEL